MITAFDSETHLIQPGLVLPPPVCWSFADGESVELLNAQDGLDLLEVLLRDDDVLVGHYTAFDLGVACAARSYLLPLVWRAYEDGRIRCTKLRQQLLDLAIAGRRRVNGGLLALRNGEWTKADYTLRGLEVLHLNRDRAEDKYGENSWRLRYAELEHLPVWEWPEDARRYAMEDAGGTLSVFLKQGELPTLIGPAWKGGPLTDESPQVWTDFCLTLASARGIRTDGLTLDQLEVLCRTIRDEVREKARAAGLYRFQGPKKDPQRKIVKDTKAVKERVVKCYEQLGKEVPLTEKGGIKTDKDTLLQTGDELLKEMAGAAAYGTVLQTFIPAMRRGIDHPINTRFTTLLETGRISASDPNLNNVPRKLGDEKSNPSNLGVRESVIPREGFYYSSVDYASAELRSLAQVCINLFGFSLLGKFYQSDPKGDPILAIAAEILGISLDEAKRRKKSGDKRIKLLRQGLKAVVYGLPGGMGIDRLIDTARIQYDTILTRDEAQFYKDAYYRWAPEVPRYLNWIAQRAQGGEFTVQQMVSGRVRAGCGYCDGANTLFQGLTADAAKAAVRELTRRCLLDPSSALFGSHLVFFLYDETILEVPIATADAAAREHCQVMIDFAQPYMKDVPLHAEPALMERWYKEAEALYGPDGQLIPWRPQL